MKKALLLFAFAFVMLWADWSLGEGKEAKTELSGPVCVIVDLTGGPDAPNYPLVEMDKLPDDFNSSLYKTKKIILKRIESGSFTMGEALVATPTHSVTLSDAYYMGIFEITQAQWENVMGPGTFHFDDNATRPAEKTSWGDIRGNSRMHDWPAVKTVGPNSFMGKLTAKTGTAGRFDLPTEAQWEYACRAGSDSPWHFGDDEENAGDHAWFKGNSGKATHEVGTKQPNDWGFFDLHGNVWEWCLDRFGSYSPKEQVDPAGASSGWYRIWRGGGWEDYEYMLQSAHRNGGASSDRSISVGFRLVWSNN